MEKPSLSGQRIKTRKRGKLTWIVSFYKTQRTLETKNIINSIQCRNAFSMPCLFILSNSDEKEKYDPIGFRDAILTGFEANNCSASDLEGVHKVSISYIVFICHTVLFLV